MITQKRKESFTYGNVLRITGYISLVVSIYLIGEHYGKGPSICGGADNTIAGVKASCTLVNHSKYSSILGIPVSFLGVSWNVILLLVGREILKGATSQHTPHSHLHQEQFIVFQLFWCLLGVFSVFYFIWAEFMLKAICPMCTIVHILTLIQFFCAWKTYRLANLNILSEFEGPTWWWRLLVRSQVLKEWSCWIIGVHLMLLICFTILPDVLSAPIDESLAKCIASSPSVWMFGANTCSVCQRQKAMFQPPGTFDKFMGPSNPSISPSSIGAASPGMSQSLAHSLLPSIWFFPGFSPFDSVISFVLTW
jgi:uncharacterized membrane protein